MVIQQQRTLSLGNLVTTGTSLTASDAAGSLGALDLRPLGGFSVQAALDVNTPSATTFEEADVNVTTNLVTKAAHGLTTGLKGQASTTTTLPAGLSTSTDYFIYAASANTYGFANSLVNAQAGTLIDLTDDGTGTHTFTPTSIAGGACKLQYSNNPTVLAPSYTYVAADWTDAAAATSVTADATLLFERTDPQALAALVHITLTAGRIGTTLYLVSRSSGQ